jgi:hypothetical protein
LLELPLIVVVLACGLVAGGVAAVVGEFLCVTMTTTLVSANTPKSSRRTRRALRIRGSLLLGMAAIVAH